MLTTSTSYARSSTPFVLTILLIPSFIKYFLGSFVLSGFTAFVITLMFAIRGKKETLSPTGSSSLPSSPPSNDSKFTIRILSYNMFMRPPLVRNNSSDHKEGRLEAFIERMKRGEFDIMALQEIFSLANSRQQRLIEAARKCGYHHHVVSISPKLNLTDFLFPVIRTSTRRPKLIDAGLLILSKFPIVETDFHIYEAGNQIDAYAAKQVVYAKVQLAKDRFVHLFNTHMQATYFDNDASTNVVNNNARHLQVVEMGNFIRRKTQGSPFPSIITGDFNINSRPGPTGTVEVSVWDHDLCSSHIANYVEVHGIEIAADGRIVSEEMEEYSFMLSMIDPCHSETKLRDLLYENHFPNHPITFGDTFSCPTTGNFLPRETILTHSADHHSALSIDYIFYSDTPTNLRSKDIRVIEGSTKVEEFFVVSSQDNKLTFTQLSDHYGVSTELEITPC